MADSDQTFKADAGKPDPYLVAQLPDFLVRAALYHHRPSLGHKGKVRKWAQDALQVLPMDNRTIGMYRAFRHGEQKYEAFSWSVVDGGVERYLKSGIRHFMPELFYVEDGPAFCDTGEGGSGLHHFDHAAASFAIVLDLLGGVEFTYPKQLSLPYMEPGA